MTIQLDKKPNSKKGRGALKICIALFTLYFINVLFGKTNISYGLNLPHLGSVAEFLLLFISSVSLIVAALKSESIEK